MGEPVEEPVSGGTRRRRWPIVVGIAAGVLVLVVAVLGFLIAREVGRKAPNYPSLSAQPDPSLHGTVAYTDRSGCVRIIAASGAASKDVLCLPQGQDVGKAERLGKEIGPQLVWLPDGRLEVTMFRMPETPGPGVRPGWQKIVDVRTGAVEDVAEAQVPSAPNLGTRTMTSPSGERIEYTRPWSDDDRASLWLVSPDGSKRRLMSAPGPHGYGLNAAFWSPDFEWIAADDGRILVVSPGDPTTVRMLVDGAGGPTFGEGVGQESTFAVTAEDILSSGS